MEMATHPNMCLSKQLRKPQRGRLYRARDRKRQLLKQSNRKESL
jgi:hypothetical protein